MTNVVRPCIAASIACRISCSVSGSIEAKASSRIRIGGSSRMARGDRQPLPLAAGQVRSVFADDRVVAVRQVADEVVGRGDLGRPLDLLARRLGMAEGDVRRHRVAEQEALLKHEADAAPQSVEIEIADVDAVDQHAAARSRRRTAESDSAACSCRRRSRRRSPRTAPAGLRDRCPSTHRHARGDSRSRLRRTGRCREMRPRTDRLLGSFRLRAAHRESRTRVPRRSGWSECCWRCW